jgi:hypothetical protein
MPGYGGSFATADTRGGYTAVTDVLRDIRQGDQAQVDFAQFQLQFTDEPTSMRIIWRPSRRSAASLTMTA